MSVFLRKKFGLKRNRKWKCFWKEEEKRREKGYEERERRKGVSLVFLFLKGIVHYVYGVGEKGLGRKRIGKKREGGGRGLVAIEACGWSPTCFVVVLVSHHTHPFPHHHLSFVLSCPSLVLFLFLPVCVCVSECESGRAWWLVDCE